MPRTLPPLLVLLLAGCSGPPAPPAPDPEPPPLAEAPQLIALTPRGLNAGVAFLRKHQSEDGAWRSDVYAAFKDGTALTPLTTAALLEATDTSLAASVNPLSCSITFAPFAELEPLLKASSWLARRARPDGTIDEGPDGLPYPTYTAALSVLVLSRSENASSAAARDAWLKYLLARQLTRQNGWKPGDKQYGGWGYYPGIPKKPAPGQAVPAQQLLESNLSATVFALEALKAAGFEDPKVLGAARRFVESCRNADGGFHFISDDPVRNKAGAADPGPDGSPRFRSYGSATADGVRALLLCGAKPTDEPVAAGRAWLEQHFAADRHPGDYVPTYERNRNAVYFYYARSVAKTFRALGVTEARGRPWAEDLTAALLARQKPDGSWENPLDPQRENDPIVATAYAVSALAECRQALAK